MRINVAQAYLEIINYRDIFVSGGLLAGMDPTKVSNLDKALENARLLANDVLRLMPAKEIKVKAPRRAAVTKKAA